MKKIIALAVVVIVVLAAVVTCPDRQKHREVLKEAMNQAMAEVVQETVGADKSVFGFGLSTIGTTLASRLIENVVASTLVVKDYFVVSIGQVTVSGKTKTVSIGLFGHVFPTFDSDDIRKAVNGDGNENEDENED